MQTFARFLKLFRVATSDDAKKPVAAGHINSGSKCASDIQIFEPYFPFLAAMQIAFRRHEMHLISKLGTVHTLSMKLKNLFLYLTRLGHCREDSKFNVNIQKEYFNIVPFASLLH